MLRIAVKSLVFVDSYQVLVASAKFHKHASYTIARLKRVTIGLLIKKPSRNHKQIGSETYSPLGGPHYVSHSSHHQRHRWYYLVTIRSIHSWWH